jgi:hypothetical protein
MAQTKRKRRTKHRGNAAGIVEHRGRTSRPPSPEERKKAQKAQGRNARADRYSKPPTWSSAATRAAIVTLLFIAVITFVMKRPLSASVALGGFMFLLYVPIGYFTDSFFYKRRQEQLARGKKKDH